MINTKFKNLHKQADLLILGNVWDAYTAKIAQDAGFKALGSSSHAIANAMGYADGEKISVDELLFVVERIVKAVTIPVSVDFESGYSDKPEIVAQYVKRLVNLGVVGINLEDGQVKNGKRELGDMELHQHKIEAIKSVTKDIFINARTDTYTTKHANALEESIKRVNAYTKAGADGSFVPLIETEEDIKIFLEKTSLPLNVFLTANLPTIEKLNKLGVKRLSHGAKIYDWLIQQNTKLFQDFIKNPKLPK
ncbi:isocitrate lyase/PEP mutase family protein [Sphingobacterium bovistauri]|uniref:Isocitrate lyase/phosphoenolpyruvate mutase family protein n=1 Tax=Sphingobacterium bovistauri TaxID=2781959 RepID=A0ABS7ZA58_9SPHI|nr:isocitrate lyase/phosphoenolpyruvate mutase family protein [Sphingobacterium bovistauri]MCA5006467.1 isocitrate lyase/phosphoenolpyruvate mutase family protein [Sphingobacterium bovistauri]